MKISPNSFFHSVNGLIYTVAAIGFFSTNSVFSEENPPAPKPPYRILYSNDLTNIQSCPSPFRQGGTFRDESMAASVAETAGTGIDVHMLQPGLGWVPWWPSKVLPMSEHVAYLESVGKTPNSFERYVLAGGDLVKIFVEECRKKGMAPFISLRVNDTHHVSRGMKLENEEERLKAMSEFRLFADHPEWRLGPGADPEERTQYAFDFSRKEIRDYKLAIIRELCENYDIDGLELDLMRHWRFFHGKKTTPEERVEIMTDFVRQVRAILDETSRPGQRRSLGVRVSGYPETHPAMGIDLVEMAKVGVDMVNASGHYFTDMQMDIAPIREMLPENVGVYSEVQFTSTGIPPYDDKGKQYRRTTPQQFYTVAHLNYARGGAGVSTFNFQYYRGTRNPDDVPGNPAEPPFHIFERLRDPEWLAQQPQQYVVASLWNAPQKGERPFKKPIAVGESVTMKLDMAPPKGGWKSGGTMRIQDRDSLGDSRWSAKINGIELKATDDVSEPYENPYDSAIGQPEDYRAFTVPPEVLKDGINEIELTLLDGAKEANLVYLDVNVR